jgi:hypothetical protein
LYFPLFSVETWVEVLDPFPGGMEPAMELVLLLPLLLNNAWQVTGPNVLPPVAASMANASLTLTVSDGKLFNYFGWYN